MERALELGLTDPAAVWHLAQEPAPVRQALEETEDWGQYQRPLPDVAEYDQLLAGGGAQ